MTGGCARRGAAARALHAPLQADTRDAVARAARARARGHALANPQVLQEGVMEFVNSISHIVHAAVATRCGRGRAAARRAPARCRVMALLSATNDS